MAAQDKTVKITIVVDDAAAQKAKRAIMEIKQEVDRLVASTQQLGGFLGGLGAVKVGNKAGQAGMSSATQATHSAAGGAMGGVTQAIAGGAKAGAAEIRKTAEETNKSFKSMKDNFKNLVDSQDREVRRMEGIFGRFRRMFGGNQVGQGQGPIGNGVGGVGAVAGGGGAPGVSNPPNAPRPGTSAGGSGGGGPGGGGGGGGTAGMGSFFGLTASGLFKGGGASIWAGGSNGMLAGIAGQMGLPMGVPTPAMAVQMGAKIAGAAMSASRENQMANLNQALAAPMFAQNARAQIGDTMGMNALAMRHGDVARWAAIRATESDPNYKKLMGQDYLLEAKRQVENPVGLRAGIASGRAGDALSAATGALFGNKLAGVQVEGIGSKNAMEIAQENARYEQLALQAQRRQDMINAKMREDPEYNERLNDQYARSGQDSSLMRGLGMSGRDMRIAGKDSPLVTARKKIEMIALGAGRDMGEYTAGFSQLEGYGRGFASFGNAAGILGAQTGGLHNAAAIQGVGAQFGKYGGLMGGVQGMIGRGGLDVTGGMQLSQMALGQMQRGDFYAGSGTGGSGLMETLMTAAVGAGGSSTGGQMRVARELSQGQGFADREAAGGVDNLNKALNMRAAMKASPEAPWAVRNMLTSMSEGQLNDIIKSGGKNMPTIFTDNGITFDMVQKYYGAKNATMFARFGKSSAYGTAEQRDVVSQYRAAGGLGFLKGKSPREIEKALNILAGAGAAGAGGLNDNLTMLRKQAANIGVYGKPHGRGAHDVLASGTTIAAANESKGVIEGVTGMKESKEGSAARENIDSMAMGKELESNSSKQARRNIHSGGDIGTAVTAVTTALQNLAAAISNMDLGSPRGGGKRVAAAGG